MHFQFRPLFPLPPPLADFFIVWPVISACFSRLFLKVFFQPIFWPFILSQVFQLFSQFSAYFLHLLSLPWQIFPILWPISSVCLFSLFFELIFSANFRPLFQLCGLVPSHLSTKLYTHCLLHWFSSHLANFSLSSFIHFSPLRIFSHCWTYFFSQFFSHLVSLPHTSPPKSFIHVANSGSNEQKSCMKYFHILSQGSTMALHTLWNTFTYFEKYFHMWNTFTYFHRALPWELHNWHSHSWHYPQNTYLYWNICACILLAHYYAIDAQSSFILPRHAFLIGFPITNSKS